MVTDFLCFNRRNSQLRDGGEDLIQGVLIVSRFLLSNILNMDQIPLPWEYLEGKTYELKGKRTVWVKSKKSGWHTTGDDPAYNLCRWSSQSKAALIFAASKSAARRQVALHYDPLVVVEFNKKANANTEIIVFWLEKLLLPVLGNHPTLLIMGILRSHKTGLVPKILKANRLSAKALFNLSLCVHSTCPPLAYLHCAKP